MKIRPTLFRLPLIIVIAIATMLMAASCTLKNPNQNGRIDVPPKRFTGIPQRMEEEEGGFTAVWTLFPSGNQFEAKWSNGAVAILTVEKFDSEGVRIVRRDSSESVSKNFGAVYTGKISGNSVNGDVTFAQNGKSWGGTWSARW